MTMIRIATRILTLLPVRCKSTLLILLVLVSGLLIFAVDDLYRLAVDAWPWVSLILWGVLR